MVIFCQPFWMAAITNKKTLQQDAYFPLVDCPDHTPPSLPHDHTPPLVTTPCSRPGHTPSHTHTPQSHTHPDPLHAEIHTPLWTEGMTHAFENITFSQLLLKVVEITTTTTIDLWFKIDTCNKYQAPLSLGESSASTSCWPSWQPSQMATITHNLKITTMVPQFSIDACNKYQTPPCWPSELNF